MPREIVDIPTCKSYASVGAAMFLAVIIYPECRTKRMELINAMFALFQKRKYGRLRLGDFTNEGMLKFSESRAIESVLSKATGIFSNKRLMAYQLARDRMASNLSVGLSLQTPQTSDPVKLLSFNALLEERFSPSPKTSGDHAKNNALRRVWKSSKPVLHLIAGLCDALPLEQRKKSLVNWVVDNDWVEKGIVGAEDWRESFCGKMRIPSLGNPEPLFGFEDEITIQLRAAPNWEPEIS